MSVSSGKPCKHSNIPDSIFHSWRSEEIASANKDSTALTIQYSFKPSSYFSLRFMNSTPQFHPHMDLSARNLPCLLFLHGSTPGGFDVSRWMASGISQIQSIWDPVSRYSALNVLDTSTGAFCEQGGSKEEQTQSSASKYDYFNIFNPTILEAASDPAKSPEKTRHFTALGMLNTSRPGYLNSSLTIEDTFHSEALSVLRLLNSLSIRSIRIIAHDTGALTAMELASLPQFKDRVRSLVLIDPVLSDPRSKIFALRKSLLVPSFLKNRYFYSKIKSGYDSKEFKNFVKEECGPLALEEMSSCTEMEMLYKYLGVLYSRNENRNPGIKSDLIKLLHFAANESQIRRQWNFVSSPTLVISTSSTKDEFTLNEFNSNSEILLEQRKSALLNVGSRTLKFARVCGGGKTMFPIGEISKTTLDFLNSYGYIG
ncbi:hypothetical protein BB560_003241 [Smittium megazygosporum]|uniref:AB hydrolase-1 domain-containing protein n=1 Tax=Smittium megazygosporum TaxID=133381 RepID=A0A2T9ZCM3_9FUNG|nr:hypothetical protein BB560_003241 [Smittium megazygosporum]